jgi:hypothetical protein
LQLYLKATNRTTKPYAMTNNDAGVRNQAKQSQASAKPSDRRFYKLKDSKSALTPSKLNDGVELTSLQEHYDDIEVTLGFSPKLTPSIHIQDEIHGVGNSTINPNSYAGSSSRANSTREQSIRTTNASTTGR